MKLLNFNKIGKINTILAQFGYPKPIMSIHFNCIVNRKPDPLFPNSRTSICYRYDFNDKENYLLDFSGSYLNISSKENKSKINSNLNVSAAIYPKHFAHLKLLIKSIDKWFSTEYLDLFNYDQNDNPCGINTQKYPKTAVMVKYKLSNRICYLGAKPTIVTQAEDNYKGILLVCDSGILGAITYDEYIHFKCVLEEIMRNFYSLALDTLNTGIRMAEINNNT